MQDRLFVGIMAHQNAGKSTTWNKLFGSTVRRGKNSRPLSLGDGDCVDVYVVSGSFEERQEYAGDVLEDKTARIVLCSVQYLEKGWDTIQYVKDNQFDLYIQWLNPGFNDSGAYFDRLGYVQRLLDLGATVAMRDGKIDPTNRIEEIRAYILGWARSRNLTYAC